MLEEVRGGEGGKKRGEEKKITRLDAAVHRRVEENEGGREKKKKKKSINFLNVDPVVSSKPGQQGEKKKKGRGQGLAYHNLLSPRQSASGGKERLSRKRTSSETSGS